MLPFQVSSKKDEIWNGIVPFWILSILDETCVMGMSM